MPPVKRFFDELRRRKVLPSALAYAAIGWLFMQGAAIILPVFDFPQWILRIVVIVVIICFPFAIAFSWFFDITANGIVRTAVLPEETSNQPNPPDTLSGPPTDEGEICSVTVLPFDNLSIEPNQDVLTDGLATEIHSVLGQMHQVRVASRRSALRFRDSAQSVKEIATALNVRYVLSGSLMRAGNRLRIFAALDDAATDTQIWSQKFERNVDDLLTIQTEIAEAIVGSFGIERERSEIARAKAQPTESLDAWSLLQRARHYINDYSEKSLAEALKLLESAIELDPDYAAAHAALGSVLIERVLNGYSDNPPADREKALEAIHKAQQLEPHDHFVLKMAGMVLAACGRPGGALGALRECVKLAPFDFGAWGYFGWPLTARGKPEDLAELNHIMDRLLKAAPEHPGAGYWLYHKSVACLLQDDINTAKDLIDQAFARHQPVPWAHLHLANICGLQGNNEAAKILKDKAASLNPKLTLEHYADCIRAMTGNTENTNVRLAGLTQAC